MIRVEQKYRSIFVDTCNRLGLFFDYETERRLVYTSKTGISINLVVEGQFFEDIEITLLYPNESEDFSNWLVMEAYEEIFEMKLDMSLQNQLIFIEENFEGWLAVPENFRAIYNKLNTRSFFSASPQD